VRRSTRVPGGSTSMDTGTTDTVEVRVARVRRRSRDLADCVEVECTICSSRHSPAAFKEHTKKQHMMTVSEYTRMFGRVEVMEDVEHLCRLCSHPVTLDLAKLGSHLTAAHGWGLDRYCREYMVDSRQGEAAARESEVEKEKTGSVEDENRDIEAENVEEMLGETREDGFDGEGNIDRKKKVRGNSNVGKEEQEKSETKNKSGSSRTCDLCPHVARTLFYLKRHKVCHGRTIEDLWISCPFCDYSTTGQNKSNLDNHVKLHAEPGLKKGRHSCDLCPFKTDESKNMKKHKKCHGRSEEEIMAMWLSCHDCDFKISKSFKILFKQHLKLHSEIKDKKEHENQPREEEASSEEEEDEVNMWTDEDSEDEEESDYKWSEVEESDDDSKGGKAVGDESCSSEEGESTVFSSVVMSQEVKEELEVNSPEMKEQEAHSLGMKKEICSPGMKEVGSLGITVKQELVGDVEFTPTEVEDLLGED